MQNCHRNTESGSKEVRGDHKETLNEDNECKMKYKTWQKMRENDHFVPMLTMHD